MPKGENSACPPQSLNTYPMKLSLALALLAVVPISAMAQLAPSISSANETSSERALQLEKMVVTGVFNATAASEATVAVTTISQDLRAIQVPVAGIDYLLNVPGVFVNSAHGEIRGVVYSRGVSADSGTQTNGYYYVSLQEENLPITNVIFGNYGPDYFQRPDATLHRVEALRGGSAAIAAANAPGGAFNYISKIGTAAPSGEIRSRIGYEGDLEPYYRGDINLGGPILDSGWLYNIGGFYRRNNGHRPPKGYPLNDGGQLKANLFKDYGKGFMKIYYKDLNDRNHWLEYLLARNPKNPKVDSNYSKYSGSLFPGPAEFTYAYGSVDSLKTFNVKDMVHNTQQVLGYTWGHDFGNGWSAASNSKISRSQADWNSSASSDPRSMSWPVALGEMNVAFNQAMATPAGTVPAGRAAAGWYNFSLHGRQIGRISSNGSYNASGASTSNPGQVVEFWNAPGSNFNLGSNVAPSYFPVWRNNARVAFEHMNEYFNNFTITKEFSNMVFSGGVYYAYSDMDSRNGDGGKALQTIDRQPDLIHFTWEPATASRAPAGTSAANIAAVSGWAAHGVPIQMTNRYGFYATGQSVGYNDAIFRNWAGFFGHKWKINPKWTTDWGFRAENYRGRGWNRSSTGLPRGLAWDPTWGGVDGDPVTFYDNRVGIMRPEVEANGTRRWWKYDKDVDSFSWSAASNHIINENNSFYLRYADGEKAPSAALFRSLNSQFRIDRLEMIPQTTQQWELGYRYDKGRANFVFTPYYSLLGTIWNSPSALEADGVTPYFPEPFFNSTRSYGVELEGGWQLTNRVHFRSVFTWNRSIGVTWKNFQAGANGPDDDFYLDFSGRPQANVPDFQLNSIMTYRGPRYFANVAWKHMGERAGNIANVITLARFNQFDVAFGYEFSDRWSLNVNINNALNSEGVMSWEGWGVNSGDKESFTSLPPDIENQSMQVVTVPPRSVFLTMTYKFGALR